MSDGGDVHRGMREVAQAFIQKLPARIEKVVGLWQDYCVDGGDATLLQFRAEVHKLKGTAATYGYVSLAAVLQQMELTLMEAKNGSIFKASSMAANIEVHIRKLQNEDWLRANEAGAA